MTRFNEGYHLLYLDSKRNIIKINSYRLHTYRDMINIISNMYENQKNVIKVNADSYIYINNNKEEIEVRFIRHSPEYIFGLWSDDKNIQKRLIQLRQGIF